MIVVIYLLILYSKKNSEFVKGEVDLSLCLNLCCHLIDKPHLGLHLGRQKINESLREKSCLKIVVI